MTKRDNVSIVSQKDPDNDFHWLIITSFFFKDELDIDLSSFRKKGMVKVTPINSHLHFYDFYKDYKMYLKNTQLNMSDHRVAFINYCLELIVPLYYKHESHKATLWKCHIEPHFIKNAHLPLIETVYNVKRPRPKEQESNIVTFSKPRVVKKKRIMKGELISSDLDRRTPKSICNNKLLIEYVYLIELIFILNNNDDRSRKEYIEEYDSIIKVRNSKLNGFLELAIANVKMYIINKRPKFKFDLVDRAVKNSNNIDYKNLINLIKN